MCVGEGPGFDPHSSSSWPEVCVYKQPSLRAFICPVGRGAIKVRYAFVMWHVRLPQPPLSCHLLLLWLSRTTCGRRAIPSYYYYSNIFLLQPLCFLISFFDFLDFLILKEEKVDISLARLFIRTPTDLHSIMYIVASRERLVPTSGVGCTRAEKKEKEIKTRPFLLLAESDQSQCLPYVVASSTLHIYTYVPSSYSAVGLFLSIPESVRHQRYLNTMQSLSAAQSILPSTWWISPYVCLDQWASGWVGGCRDNSRSRLSSQIGIWNRVKLKKRQWHQGVQKRRRIGQKK